MILSPVLAQVIVRTLPPSRLTVSANAHIDVSPAESALPKNRPVTRLESADPKILDLKSFRIRTYRKWWGRVQIVNQPSPHIRVSEKGNATAHRPARAPSPKRKSTRSCATSSRRTDPRSTPEPRSANPGIA